MTYETNYISHHGVKGQKWGVRRYQNKNGSLTSEGKRRYGGKESLKKVNTSKKGNASKKSVVSKIKEKYQSLPDGTQKAIKIGAAVASVYFGTQLVGSAVTSMTILPFVRQTFNDVMNKKVGFEKEFADFKKEHEEFSKNLDKGVAEHDRLYEEELRKMEEFRKKHFGGN